MSESDTMFNERDQRCAAVQHVLSTDPSYDNRTIASTLKMQIRTVQRAQRDENKVSGYGYGLWCGFKWGPHHATSHFLSLLKVNTKVYLDVLKSAVIPWCNQVAWPVADPGCGSKTRCRATSPKRHWRGFRLCTLLSLDPSSSDLNSLDNFFWSYVENITNMTSHNTKANTKVFAELPPALLEKACFQFRIRIEAVIEAEGSYIE